MLWKHNAARIAYEAVNRCGIREQFEPILKLLGHSHFN